MIWFGLVYKACHSERTLHLVPSALWQVSSTCTFSVFVSMTYLVPSALWQLSACVGVVPLASLHRRTSTGYEPCALGQLPFRLRRNFRLYRAPRRSSSSPALPRHRVTCPLVACHVAHRSARSFLRYRPIFVLDLRSLSCCPLLVFQELLHLSSFPLGF